MVYLQLYNQDKRTVEELLQEEIILIAKEPYLQPMSDGNCSARTVFLTLCISIHMASGTQRDSLALLCSGKKRVMNSSVRASILVSLNVDSFISTFCKVQQLHEICQL